MGHMPESLRLYVLCRGFNWCHLPNEGGIYHQSAELMDEWMVIMNEESLAEKDKSRKERDGKMGSASSARRSTRRSKQR